MKTSTAWILFRAKRKNHAWPAATTTVADNGEGYSITCNAEHAVAQGLGYTDNFDDMLDYIENNEDDGADDGPEPGEEAEGVEEDEEEDEEEEESKE